MRPETRCRLFLVRTPETVDTGHFALLDDAEQRRCQKLRKPENRARFTTAHALLRMTLAAALGTTPQDVVIRAGTNRRPELGHGTGPDDCNVDFNLSSTPGYAACAIGFAVRVGIDLELTQPDQGGAGLWDRVLTTAERQWLEQSSDPAAFYRLWTLKEALAKADGEGLGLPFNRLEVLPNDRGSFDLDLQVLTRTDWSWRIISLDSEVPAALALAGTETGGTILINDGLPSCFQAVQAQTGTEAQNR